MDVPYSNDNQGVRMDHTTLTPRYSVANDDSLNDGIAYLTENGYAVFSDVLTLDEVNAGKDLLWNFLENIDGCAIRRNDPSSWSAYW